jgi:hypothetical protein
MHSLSLLTSLVPHQTAPASNPGTTTRAGLAIGVLLAAILWAICSEPLARLQTELSGLRETVRSQQDAFSLSGYVEDVQVREATILSYTDDTHHFALQPPLLHHLLPSPQSLSWLTTR